RFRAAATRFVSTSSRALAKVDGAYYSVPQRWARLEIQAYVGVDTVELVGPDGRVAHPRQGYGCSSVVYRHYLPELARKPQALRQVAGTLVAQLGEPYAAAWRQLVDAHGPKEAARLFARVVGAVVECGEADVARRLERALADDVPIALALAPAPEVAPSVSEDALPAQLAGIDVEAGVAADYDALLGGER